MCIIKFPMFFLTPWKYLVEGKAEEQREDKDIQNKIILTIKLLELFNYLEYGI